MGNVARVLLSVVGIAVIVGATCFVTWVALLLVVAGWRLVGLGLRALGWPTMGQRSESARLRFMEAISRVAPLPHLRRISPYEGAPGA